MRANYPGKDVIDEAVTIPATIAAITALDRKLEVQENKAE